MTEAWTRLADSLHRLREAWQAGLGLPHLGLEHDDWKALMTSDSIGQVRRILVRQVLPALRGKA